ncbi:MAG: SAF domain-containing protein [Microthrixaceae bacterium]|nr:hypothetical protein [Microthrixaceae bacterium]MCO5313085.1 SAF domain-containing protein [Microthrixaceae bacterium]
MASTILNPRSKTPGRSRAESGRTPAGEPLDDPVSITRRLRRSAGLPSGRALAGALMVTVAVLGVVAAYRDATTTATTEWIVVGRSVAAGTIISAEDLAYAPADLNDATARRSFTNPDDVIGQEALITLERGDLVLASAISEPLGTDANTGRAIGLTLDAARALGGNLSVGDRIDIYALGSSGSDAEVLERNARITAVRGTTGESIGNSASVGFTVAVSDEAAALRIVTAESTVGLTVVKGSPHPADPESAR